MKKIMAIAVLFFLSCSAEYVNPKVRFKNASFTNVVYGIGLGDAEYNGYFGIGETTSYFCTEQGSFRIEFKDNNGKWNVMCSDLFQVLPDKKYTVTMHSISSFTITAD